MGLTAQAAQAAALGFAAAGDALSKVTLKLGPSEGAYDPATDVTTTTWEQDTADVDALAFTSKSTRDNMNFETRTQSFLVLGSAVTAGRPNQSGNVVDAYGITWQIYSVETDPTNAVWIFHCTS